jgi:hypothetical protein
MNASLGTRRLTWHSLRAQKLWPTAIALIYAVLAISDLGAQPHAETEAGATNVLGDPQLMSDHPWFPGELSCSTFERLFATQASLYKRATGLNADTDQDRAIASWYWRNLNFYHNYTPREHYWGYPDLIETEDNRDVVREYWNGLFSYGFALCGTTHAQYTAEMQYLLGHARARTVDVTGHTSFEVFLKDAQYGPKGDWAVLDHDTSTIVFDDPKSPRRLLNHWDIAYSSKAPEAVPRTESELESLLDNAHAPEGNRGWYKSGLYYPRENTDARDSDAMGTYNHVRSSASLSGYASAPPMVALRRNETLRRYLQPGLGSKQYVYWGPNMQREAGIPGPGRDRTWASEPERMYRAERDTETEPVAHYGNAVYTYRPDFLDGSYRDAVISEDDKSVTFYFHSAYVIAATPAKANAQELWAAMYPGASNGLVITGQRADCTVQVSTDHGNTWSNPVAMAPKAQVDLTDEVKGRHAYLLRLNAPLEKLASMDIDIRTVCMANDRLMPHLKSQGSTITYQWSGKAVFSVGPSKNLAATYVTDGGFGTDHVEMTIPAPAGSRILAVYSMAQVSSEHSDENIRYDIDCSTSRDSSWLPIVEDWRVEKHGYQMPETSSLSYCYGNRELSEPAEEVTVRFSNDGQVKYERAEVHVVYQVSRRQPLRVIFGWTESEASQGLPKTASHVFKADSESQALTWTIPTADVVETNWVDMKIEH